MNSAGPLSSSYIPPQQQYIPTIPRPGVKVDHVFLPLVCASHIAVIRELFVCFQENYTTVDWNKFSLAIANANQNYTFSPEDLKSACSDFVWLPEPWGRSLDALSHLQLWKYRATLQSDGSKALELSEVGLAKELLNAVENTFKGSQRKTLEGLQNFWLEVYRFIASQPISLNGLSADYCYDIAMNMMKMNQQTQVIGPNNETVLLKLCRIYYTLNLYNPQVIRDLLFYVNGWCYSTETIHQFFSEKINAPSDENLHSFLPIIGQMNNAHVEELVFILAGQLQWDPNVSVQEASLLSSGWSAGYDGLLKQAILNQWHGSFSLLDWNRVANDLCISTQGRFFKPPDECQARLEQMMPQGYHLFVSDEDKSVIETLIPCYLTQGTLDAKKMQEDILALMGQTYDLFGIESVFRGIREPLNSPFSSQSDPEQMKSQLIEKLQFYSLRNVVDESLIFDDGLFGEAPQSWTLDDSLCLQVDAGSSPNDLNPLIFEEFSKESSSQLSSLTQSSSKETLSIGSAKGRNPDEYHRMVDILHKVMSEAGNDIIKTNGRVCWVEVADLCEKEAQKQGEKYEFTNKWCSAAATHQLKPNCISKVPSVDHETICQLALRYTGKKNTVSWVRLQNDMLSILGKAYSTEAMKNVFHSKKAAKVKKDLSESNKSLMEKLQFHD